jgi:hypothetical protein
VATPPSPFQDASGGYNRRRSVAVAACLGAPLPEPTGFDEQREEVIVVRHSYERGFRKELRWIPCARLAPIIEEFLEDEKITVAVFAELLERQTGKPATSWCRMVFAIRKWDRLVLDKRGKLVPQRLRVEFDTADQILAAMDRPDFWTNELADLYTGESVSA